jgi:hypothetical protein
MSFSTRLAQICSKLKEEIGFRFLNEKSKTVLSDAEQKFFNANLIKWATKPAVKGKGLILIEGILADYGPNYLYRTGLITKSIQEKYPELTPLVLYDRLLHHHKKSIRLYESFGFSNYYSLASNIINQLYKIPARIHSYFIIKNIANGEELLKLSFKGIHLGDLVYDSITSSLKKYKTIDVIEEDMKPFIKKSIYEILIYQKFFKKFTPEFFVSTHPCYVTYGTLCRVALKNGTRVLMTTDIELVELEKNSDPLVKWTPVFHEFVQKYVQRKILTYQNPDETIEASKAYLKERLLGNIDQVDVQLAYASKSQYSEENLRLKLGLDNKKPITFIFAHIIADAPHCSHFLLYKDYFVWLKETLKLCKELPDTYWLVKAHPAAKAYNEEGIVEKLVEDCGVDHIKVVPADFNTNSAFQYAQSLLTINGTAGLEFACFGVPVVLAGRPFYSGFGITHEPNSLAEYFDTLKNMNRISRLSPEQIRKAYLVLSAFRNYSISNNIVLTSELLMKVWGYKERDIEFVWEQMALNLAPIQPTDEPQYLRAKEILG